MNFARDVVEAAEPHRLALVALAGLLVLAHLRRPGDHWMEGLVFVLSLVIVWLGVALAH